VPTARVVPDGVDAGGGEVVVLAAGGMHDGRSLAAALAWGADGIAMGTRFLLTKESTVPDEVKARYLSTGLSGTVVSRAVDGAPQRVIATGYVERLEASGSLARLFRALASARAFRRDSGLSLPGIVREGLAMKRGSELSFAQVLMAANAPMMTKAALVDGRLDAGVLPTGQVVGRIEDLESVSDLVGEVVSGARAVLDRMQSL
jgi:NAD(P)H-dependent flavin oxidoreductase YrpB (nitropropane dioxygenase family)